MKVKDLITIIIPTFNREVKLKDAIESALNQTYKNIQLIVIDDGSTDNTAALVSRYPDIEYYYKPNGGQASARNYGLKHAKGRYIASLDSDDIWNPDFLTECVTKLEADDLDFVFANWTQEVKNGDPWDFLRNDPFLKPYFHKEKNGWIDLNPEEVRDLYLRSCTSPSSSVVLRKSSIISGWDESINIGDDWSMYLEMILSKKCLVSFTLNKLWRKRIDEINVYDGRKWNEILEFLYIEDTKRNMLKFHDKLTKKELDILQKKYMASLVELSKHKLIREFDFFGSVDLLYKSFAVNILYSLKMIPSVFISGLKRRL
ncbi:glycosyltransferase family 2 protein [Pedobacter sp. AW31-3R]|uniref:glycosyltransferase family 2 protein n=1 Tax=Pedobacter sp. AW31-3R TaxID=3445781 RepID=UPI003FA05244